jgi:sugar lactone lactonase YvrE
MIQSSPAFGFRSWPTDYILLREKSYRKLITMNKTIALLILFGFSACINAQAATQAPLREAQVTTIISQHKGAVGGLAVDALGVLYVADFQERIWKLDPNDNSLSVYASDLYGASGITFDRNGNLYQANFFGHSIFRLSRSGERELILEDSLDGPVGMVFDSEENLFICSCNDQSIKKLTPEGITSTFAKSGEFNCPNGITKNDRGDLFVVSFSGSKIVRITPQGETSVFADTKGKGLGHIIFLRGVFYATSFNDNKIYRITGDGEVVEFAGSGERKVEDGPVMAASFSNPNGIAADPTGRYLYVNDYVGDGSQSGIFRTPFSIRRIELPRLGSIMKYTLDTASLSAASAAYQAYKIDPLNFGEDTEDEVNLLGWSYMGNGSNDKAEFVFETNANSYPESWRVFSSLGAAYMRVGKNERAIEVLRRSLVLNPENHIAIARLKELNSWP